MFINSSVIFTWLSLLSDANTKGKKISISVIQHLKQTEKTDGFIDFRQ